MARRSFVERGSCIIWLVAAEAAEVMVVIKKTWTTWKQKWAVWTNNSALATDGAPVCLAHAANG